MGVLDSLGVSPNIFGSTNPATLISWAVLVIFALAVIFGTAFVTVYFYSRKVARTQYKNKIPIFTRIHGKLTRIGIDDAKEVFIPDSNISLFHLKKKKIYIARPTRAMGKDEFWYSISENGEWVNFDLSTDPKKNTLAQANYDHRDTRYAYVNLKEIVKRNYKDKAVQWWKEYSPLITFIIVSVIFVGSIWFLIAKVGGLLDQLNIMVQQMGEISETLSRAVADARSINSGVAQR